MADTTVVVSVRPRRSLLTTAFASIMLATAPVFAALYWFSAQSGTWVLVLVVHVVIAALSVSAMLRQLTVFSAVTSTELTGRGIFSPLEHVPLDEVASVTLVDTYIGQAPDPVTQLLVRDAAGRRVFRMRGNFWHPGDLRAIADALPVQVTVAPEPIGIREFFRSYPTSAYWFENRPSLWVAVVAGVIIVLAALTAFVMTVIGTPIDLSST